MKEIYVNSVAEFLETYKKFQSLFGSGLYLFRGVKNKAWEHIPVIFREFSCCQQSRIISGISISGRIYEDNEREILSHFFKEAYSYHPNIPIENHAEWLQIAQHYGVPTRLLDFTENPLVALFFCCHDMDEYEGYVSLIHFENFREWSCLNKEFVSMSPQDIMDGIINDQIFGQFLKDPEHQEVKIKDTPIIISPTYIDHRMSAQSSKFMLWGSNTNSLEKMLKEGNYMSFPSDGVRIGQSHDLRFFRKIYIDQKAKINIMKELELMNINEKTIFPGLDGIGKYIERKYRKSPDDFSWMPLVN